MSRELSEQRHRKKQSRRNHLNCLWLDNSIARNRGKEVHAMGKAFWILFGGNELGV